MALSALLLAAALAGSAPDRAVLQRLLQGFVDQEYGRAFRHLGDEKDFDHGHLLFGKDGRPRAVLYHTQELAMYEKAGGAYGWLDPEGRNWLQWLDDGRIENAAVYERASYPAGAEWDWFRFKELPALREHRTVLPKMLDGEKLGLDLSRSEQWAFTRVDACREGALPIVLPTGERVCLALSRA